MSEGIDPRLLSLLLRWQFELNTLSSVAIEVPALRPVAKKLRDALGPQKAQHKNQGNTDG